MPLPSLAHPSRDATDVADVRVFYEPLAPFGTWIALPEYGQVWRPHGVPPRWRPYTMGRWVYTDYGWTWISDWAWGWAPFHYGRWVFVTSYGWVWIPGTVWGPAWVIWRYAPGWVGWAPLPPQVVFSPGSVVGISDIEVDLEPSWFCFVEERRILAPTLITSIAPLARNGSLIQMTRNVTHYTVTQHQVVNRSIPVERIERAIRRPVPRMQIVDAPSPEVMPRATVRERAREVVMFRPDVSAVAGTPGPGGQPPKRTPPPQLTPGTTRPQPPALSPQERRMPREPERPPLEGKTGRDRQAHEPLLGPSQPRGVPPSQLPGTPSDVLQQRREAERRALEEKARRDRQAREQPLRQHQEQAPQRALPPQAHERPGAGRQQPHHHFQPTLPQGMPPQVSPPRRAAPQQAREVDKEPRKKPPPSPPSQLPHGRQ